MIRIDEIVKIAKKCDTAADIGCDHGYISREMLKNSKAQSMIAADISEKSLEKAKKLAAQRSGIHTRVGDGLSCIETGEAQVIIIAGMGGILIKNIIEKSLAKAKSACQLVLCPHSHNRELREYLFENDFYIEKEKTVCEEGKFYQIMSVIPNKKCEKPRDIFFDVGINCEKDGVYGGFLQKKINTWKSICESIYKNGGDTKKAAVLEEKIKGAEEEKKCL